MLNFELFKTGLRLKFNMPGADSPTSVLLDGAPVLHSAHIKGLMCKRKDPNLFE